ncbi:c-type cytochrome biogenesis protein CcsB [Gandjariella thermophila]|uniref:C-type cytochrome biogenesis protein CcsB n=1 Tax=Gandjariella thermophila TaxID=1931992 RepID=A0A4D4IYX5_9PSEU|nr:c-type cytochrome biogenesis protein CcsB [Gandjariella thermophila]GDY29451.1 c-type cytochrome biogenesis protein CcsB [Gandjariella thermophila]
MTVNTTLATYSDWTYATAIAIYVLSMLFYLAEQAFGRFARRSERVEAATVGGSGGGTAVLDRPAPPRVTPAGRPLPERLGRMGVALTVLGVALHASAVLTRGLAVHRVPWGNMYEYGSAVCLAAMVTWLVLMRRFPIRRLTGFVLLPIVVLLFLGGTVLYANAAPLQPALQSYWLVIHVSAAATSSGILLLPGVASLLYLVRTANEHNPRRFARLAPRLPGADMLDRLAYRTTIFAFPLFTFGIVCGAIWAESAWGRFWGWDPKETTALVAWVVYASYLHARATAGWRGNRAAVINVLGFAVMVFNLFFINLVVSGLHSYAGVNG